MQNSDLPALPWKDIAKRGWGKGLLLALLGGSTISFLGGNIQVTLINPDFKGNVGGLLELPARVGMIERNQNEFQKSMIEAIEEIPANIPAGDGELEAEVRELRAQIQAQAAEIATGVDYMKRLRVLEKGE